MNKRKMYIIFEYIITVVILVYTVVFGSVLLKDYIKDSQTSDLVGTIIHYIIAVLSIVSIIFMIKKSIYRSKFNENYINKK